MQLNTTESGSGAPVAILHGLFGSARNWASIAQRLAQRFHVIAFDMRNHGSSPWADTMSYPEMAEDVRATLQARGITRCALIGHSMGGKAAMLLALTHPECVARLVVVDIAPAAYPPRHDPYVRAMRRLDLGALKRRAEADQQLAVAVPDAPERGFLLQNLVFDPGQPPRWRINLAAIGRAMPELVGTPTVPMGARYEGPALFVAGALSDYLRAEHEPAIHRLFPHARIERVTAAGHWLHAEQPAVFLALTEPFLTEG
ncbi:MAG: alpha/beta fold hydrolase [Alphaproteobacteria bacterium]|nr:alpha/beta fold hydrolase [Alphaproteobacteria bacterium]